MSPAHAKEVARRYLDAWSSGRFPDALRIVEHFTIREGRIVRLRQVHDTAAIRAAGLAS